MKILLFSFVMLFIIILPTSDASFFPSMEESAVSPDRHELDEECLTQDLLFVATPSVIDGDLLIIYGSLGAGQSTSATLTIYSVDNSVDDPVYAETVGVPLNGCYYLTIPVVGWTQEGLHFIQLDYDAHEIAIGMVDYFLTSPFIFPS